MAKDVVFGAEIAREALGRRYVEMSLGDWRRLAGIVISCGFRSRKVQGVPMWCREL
jgi:hypothetical protein